MKQKKNFRIFSILLTGVLFIVAFRYAQKPTIYVIGDSTVRISNKEQWGWGTFLESHLDSSRIKVANHAMAGRSTRTFIKEGRWKKVDSLLKKGDFVFMQFGHNEGSVPDTTKGGGQRGVLRGTGEETKELTWRDGTKETVHTYGWYIRKFIKDTMKKGATPVVVSMIPRNQWKDGKVLRANDSYGKWAKEVAEQEGVFFIDLNKITADKYDQMGPEKVKEFFPGDHTHTNEAGAKENAASVVEGIKLIKDMPINQYLR